MERSYGDAVNVPALEVGTPAVGSFRQPQGSTERRARKMLGGGGGERERERERERGLMTGSRQEEREEKAKKKREEEEEEEKNSRKQLPVIRFLSVLADGVQRVLLVPRDTQLVILPPRTAEAVTVSPRTPASASYLPTDHLHVYGMHTDRGTSYIHRLYVNSRIAIEVQCAMCNNVVLAGSGKAWFKLSYNLR